MISPTPLTPRTKLLYFIFVGGIGFLVDGGLLTLCSQYFSFDIYMSRLLSFSVATITTWGLNRTLVFKHDADPSVRKIVEYGRYLFVQVGGGAANLLVFTLVLAIHPPLKAIPIIPLFFGSIFGLFINFAGSRYWVFVKKRSVEPSA